MKPRLCPVLLSANRMTGKTADLHKALRRYLRLRQQCERCPQAAHCLPILAADGAIHASIQLINDEWNALYDAA